MPPPEKIDGQFWELAEKVALNHNFLFKGRCAELMKEFIQDGVRNLIEKDLIDNGAAVLAASATLTGFVEGMIRDAEGPGKLSALNSTDGFYQLGENNFFGSKTRLCPCFPFC